MATSPDPSLVTRGTLRAPVAPSLPTATSPNPSLLRSGTLRVPVAPLLTKEGLGEVCRFLKQLQLSQDGGDALALLLAQRLEGRRGVVAADPHQLQRRLEAGDGRAEGDQAHQAVDPVLERPEG